MFNSIIAVKRDFDVRSARVDSGIFLGKHAFVPYDTKVTSLLTHY